MDKYGLIGRRLGHSFSIGYFNEKFENESINARYENFELGSIDELREVLDINPNLKGLNVTIPYKEQVIPLLDEISEEAAAIGAVNVVSIRYKGNKRVLKGYNSDVIGFYRSIAPLLEPNQKKALVLGTGGASKAVIYALHKLGLETQSVSRNKKTGCLTYEEITPEMMEEYKVVVNCTPLGMYPNADTFPPLPYDAMNSHTLLYDLIYNPDETLFMKKGLKYGATVKNGLEMLLLQAFVSWDMWNGNENY